MDGAEKDGSGVAAAKEQVGAEVSGEQDDVANKKYGGDDINVVKPGKGYCRPQITKIVLIFRNG